MRWWCPVGYSHLEGAVEDVTSLSVLCVPDCLTSQALVCFFVASLHGIDSSEIPSSTVTCSGLCFVWRVHTVPHHLYVYMDSRPSDTSIDSSIAINVPFEPSATDCVSTYSLNTVGFGAQSRATLIWYRVLEYAPVEVFQLKNDCFLIF